MPWPARLSLRPPSDVVGRGAVLHAINVARAGRLRHTSAVKRGRQDVGALRGVRRSTRAPSVLFGHGEDDLMAPCQLLSEAIGHLVVHPPEAVLTDHDAIRGRSCAGWARTAASTGRLDSPPEWAELERTALRCSPAALGSWTCSPVREPVVLVLDDLQRGRAVQPVAPSSPGGRQPSEPLVGPGVMPRR